jgi:hypothetical protein
VLASILVALGTFCVSAHDDAATVCGLHDFFVWRERRRRGVRGTGEKDQTAESKTHVSPTYFLQPKMIARRYTARRYAGNPPKRRTNA